MDPINELSALEVLNAACTGKTFKPSKPFTDISPGEYRVVQFKLIQTKTYGIRLTVELEDFMAWMPQRFATAINDQQKIDELNTTAEKKNLFMFYDGKDVDNFNRLKLSFLQK